MMLLRAPGSASPLSHVVDVDIIDDINILQAAMLAMDESVKKLPSPPDYVLVDGNRLPKVPGVPSLPPPPSPNRRPVKRNTLATGAGTRSSALRD